MGTFTKIVIVDNDFCKWGHLQKSFEMLLNHEVTKFKDEMNEKKKYFSYFIFNLNSTRAKPRIQLVDI